MVKGKISSHAAYQLAGIDIAWLVLAEIHDRNQQTLCFGDEMRIQASAKKHFGAFRTWNTFNLVMHN